MTRKKYSSNRQRFLEMAEARTNAVLHRIKVLGNCANRNLYDYREEEINKIFRAIQKTLDETKAKFMIQKARKKRKFSL